MFRCNKLRNFTINKVEEADKLKQLLKVVALATNIEEVEEKIRELV